MRWFVAFALLALSVGVLGATLAPDDVWVVLALRPVVLAAGVGAALLLLGVGGWRARRGRR